MQEQERKEREKERAEHQIRRQRMFDVQKGLESQLKEKQEIRQRTKRMDAYYGRMLKERDQMDIFREQDEKLRTRVNQKQLYSQLNYQAKENSNKNRFSGADSFYLIRVSR